MFKQPEVLAGFEADAEVIRKNLGGFHNDLIKRFYSKVPPNLSTNGTPLGKRVQPQDFVRIAKESINEECEDRGMKIRFNETDIKTVIEAMNRFMEETKIDFYNPVSIIPHEALDRVVRQGYLTETDAQYCKDVVRRIDERLTPEVDDNYLMTASAPSQEAAMFEEVITASYEVWSIELIEMYPELGDIDWFDFLYKVGFCFTDALGTIAGGALGLYLSGLNPIGGLIGGAIGMFLASIAFEAVTVLALGGYI